MSKYLNIGMSLREIVFRTTQRPAQVLHRPELGTLSPGSCADVTVFSIAEGSFGFADAGRARMSGSRSIRCEMTVRAGEIVYDLNARSYVPWQEAPEEYWHSPGVIPQ